MAAAAPRTSGDLLGRLTELPADIEARVEVDSPIEGLLLGETDDPHRVYAARLRLEESAAHPLGAERNLGEALSGGAGPGDAHWVNVGEEPAMALAGDVLVVSEDRESASAAVAWLATRAMDEERPTGAVLTLLEGVVSRSMHAIASAAVDRWVAEQQQNLSTERSRHDGAPVVADPEAALRIAEARVRGIVALLPDVGELSVTITSETAGPTLTMRAAVTPGSPLAQRMASYHAFETAGLTRLPAGAALRLMASSAPADGSEDAPMLLTLLGDRLDADQRGALEQLGLALHDSSGPWALASGMVQGRSFAAFFGHSEADQDVAATLRLALGAAWLAQGMSLVLGCEDSTPQVSGETDALRLGGCTGDSTRELVLAKSDATRALLAARSNEGNARMAQSMAAKFAGDGAASDLDPASQRLLSALPEQSVIAILADPAQVVPSLAGLVRAAEPPPGASAPIALAVSMDADALRLRLVLAPGAAANLANIGVGLTR